VSGWLDSGKRTDVDYAKELFEKFEKRFSPESQITAEEERELRRIIAKAVDAGLAGD
jgi:hypothetical protein